MYYWFIISDLILVASSSLFGNVRSVADHSKSGAVGDG